MPLFTMVLINAQLPNVHMILQVLLDYGEYNEQGDVSYTIANLEGSILFILGLEVPASAQIGKHKHIQVTFCLVYFFKLFYRHLLLF